MMNKLRLLAISAVVATTVQAAPFLAIGDNAELFLTGTLGVRTDSNIFLSPNARSDTIIDINPGVELVFGNASAVKGSLSFTESFANYSSHSDLNSNLASTSFYAGIEDGKSKGSVSIRYSQLNQNTVDTVGGVNKDALARRNVLGMGANAEISATEKTSVGAGVQYDKTDYLRAGYSDQETVAVPVNYFYELTPKLDVSVGYRYRRTWQQIGEDSTDHFYNVGVRGELTPKLSGTINVGIEQRHFTHLENQTLPGIDSSLTYAATPKVSLQLGVSNDFDSNAQGQQQKNLSFRGSGSFMIADEWSVTTALTYRVIDYIKLTPARSDDYFEGQIGVTYQVNNVIRVSGALAYRSNTSDLTSAEFDGTVVSLSASFRY